MTTYYKAVPICEELPEKEGMVTTNLGRLWYDKANWDFLSGSGHSLKVHTPIEWLKPCEGVLLSSSDKAAVLTRINSIMNRLADDSWFASQVDYAAIFKLLTGKDITSGSEGGENQKK